VLRRRLRLSQMAAGMRRAQKREHRACLEAAGQFLDGGRRGGRDDEVYKARSLPRALRWARACAHAGALAWPRGRTCALAWPRGRSCTRARRPGEAGAAARAQKVVTAYETRAAELAREAAGLRAALDALQREHRRLLNQQARPPRACA